MSHIFKEKTMNDIQNASNKPFPEKTVNGNIQEILKSAKTIAVVGLSDNPGRTSYGIAMVLIEEGYDVIPVNPAIEEWNGRKAYPDVKSVPTHIDIVNIFRRAEFVDAITDDAIEAKADAVWMQLGIRNEVAAAKALSAGMSVVMDRCISVELT